jgi:hypothetical protein
MSEVWQANISVISSYDILYLVGYPYYVISISMILQKVVPNQFGNLINRLKPAEGLGLDHMRKWHPRLSAGLCFVVASPFRKTQVILRIVSR